MKRYVSTCVSGLQTVASDALARTLPHYRPLRICDGMVIYETYRTAYVTPEESLTEALREKRK